MNYDMHGIESVFVRPRSPKELGEEIDRLIGEGVRVRGGTLTKDIPLALKALAGKEAPVRIEELMQQAGHPISFKESSSYAWYPHGYTIGSYLASLIAFEWNLDDLFVLGHTAAKGSFIKNVVLRFVSMQQTFEKGPAVWKKYFDGGEWVPVSLSEEKREIVFQIRGYVANVANEYFNAGYFSGIAELSTGSSEVGFNVVKSVCMGDPYSEYKISW